MGAIFPVLDENMASFIAGTWQGYAEAIDRALKAPWDTLSAIGDNWKGRRSDLFNEWWGPASTDIDTLATVAQMMAQGFTAFAARVPGINAQIVQLTTLVQANTTPGARPDRYDFHVDDPDYSADVLYVDIYGFLLDGPHGPGMPPTPPWLTQLKGLLVKVDEDYQRAVKALMADISAAPGMLKQLGQLKAISRGSAAIGSAGPFASLDDPTWKLLTGGGVFRPTLVPGFRGDPFSGKDLPGWYHPTVGQQIFNWQSGHVGDIVDVGSLLLALTGNPELSGLLELTYGGAEDAKAIADGDWGEVGLDTFGLVVNLASAGVGGTAAQGAAEDISLGHGFSEAVQGALQDSEGDIPPVVAEHFGDYVQDQVQDWIRQQITAAVDAGQPAPTKVTVPASVLNQIMNQAAANLGQDTALHAAGLPPTSSG